MWVRLENVPPRRTAVANLPRHPPTSPALQFPARHQSATAFVRRPDHTVVPRHTPTHDHRSALRHSQRHRYPDRHRASRRHCPRRSASAGRSRPYPAPARRRRKVVSPWSVRAPPSTSQPPSSNVSIRSYGVTIGVTPNSLASHLNYHSPMASQSAIRASGARYCGIVLKLAPGGSAGMLSQSLRDHHRPPRPRPQRRGTNSGFIAVGSAKISCASPKPRRDRRIPRSRPTSRIVLHMSPRRKNAANGNARAGFQRRPADCPDSPSDR